MVILFCGVAPPAATAAQPAASPRSAALVEVGGQLLAQGQLAAAAAAFTRASEQAELNGGHCEECLLGVARAVQKAIVGGSAPASPREALGILREALRVQPRGALAEAARISLCLAREPEPASPRPFPEPSRMPNASLESNVQKPLKLYTAPPVYTEAARKAKVQGAVIVESIIDAEGCVTGAHVVGALDPGLDQAALTAVRHWVFQPAEIKGKPVKVYYTLTIRFEVQDTPSAH
jgi:TonB family protein